MAMLCTTLFLTAQDDYAKYDYGDVMRADRELTVAPGDSSAEAYVLFDLLRLGMIQDNDGRPILQEYRHRQLKLLRESSFDRADVEFVYYRERENISTIKAQIHLPDGKTIKIPRKDMIRERYDDDRDIWKFTFPNVTEGAILEYAYTKSDEGITIPSRYYFQEDIPVRWAEYRALIPEYFNYVSLSNAAKYTVNSVTNQQGMFGSKTINHSKIRWAYGDLPAFTDQPYVNNFRDYIPHVRLQLASVRYPSQPVRKIFSDWKETTDKLMEYQEFGKAFSNKGNYNKVWKDVESLVAGAETDMEKISALYNFVAGRISWDGSYSILSDRTPNKVYEAASGTSGEMAILLLSLLREAGVEAQPLLVPLRNYGSPVELYPLMNQFDHLMVLANANGKSILLDPNDIQRPPGLPRFSALNGRAFVADPANPHWIDVDVPRATQTIMATVVLDESGMAEVDVRSRLNSYYAFNGRNRLDEMEEDAELPIVVSAMDAFPELEVVSHEVEQSDEISGPLNLNMKLKVPMGQQIDDFIYFQPIICPVLSKKLADVETRLYPVDFGYPWVERYISDITLPEGYVVEELPTSTRLKSEDGSMVCTMAVEDKGAGKLSLNFTVSINRTVYQPQEYAVLQKMFLQIIEMQESTIVLKKAK